MNESNAIELHTESWLKTEILCDVYFAMIKKKKIVMGRAWTSLGPSW